MTTPITLTDDQAAALDQLLAAVAQGRNAALHGAAGTGKTTLTGVLIQRLLDQGLSITVAAPTHKALGVIRDRIPAEVPCVTVASLLGLKPVQRGRWVQFIPDFKQAEKRGQLRGTAVLLIDESSQVSQQLGRDLERLAASTGTVVICVGDPHQLSPCDPPPEDGEDEDQHRGVMSQLFLAPEVGPVVLTQVVRHQGPVLQLANQIRVCTDLAAINAVWPGESISTDQSSVVVYPNQWEWLRTAKAWLSDSRWEQKPNTVRVVCWSNRACNQVSEQIRTAIHGANANRWQKGEIVANADSIQDPGKPKARPLAPSSCEWRITSTHEWSLVKAITTAEWFTPKRKERREFEIGCSLMVQRLQLTPLDSSSGREPIVVFAPPPGSTEWAELLTELRGQISKVAAGKARNLAWSAWHELKSYAADIRSAGVLTTHRAQGSSFRHVFVHAEMARCDTEDSTALHYVAVTRASEAVHVVRRALPEPASRAAALTLNSANQ